MRYAALFVLTILSACAEFPAMEYAAQRTQDAAFPGFLSPGQFGTQTDSIAAPTVQVQTRLAKLRDRAAQLRRQTLSQPDRDRINRGILP